MGLGTADSPNAEYALRRPSMLRRLYDWCIAAADKPHATWLMGAVSFVESSFFPVPPDAMHGQSDAVVRESADLLYNLVVLWVASGVHPKDVWVEMERRERLLGIAEKLPKERPEASPRRKVVALDRSRARKRR